MDESAGIDVFVLCVCVYMDESVGEGPAQRPFWSRPFDPPLRFHLRDKLTHSAHKRTLVEGEEPRPPAQQPPDAAAALEEGACICRLVNIYIYIYI